MYVYMYYDLCTYVCMKMNFLVCMSLILVDYFAYIMEVSMYLCMYVCVHVI